MVRTEVPSSGISSEFGQRSIQVSFNAEPAISLVPVVIDRTFHPNWHRTDGEAIYAITPFSILTFTNRPVTIDYERRWFEKGALLIFVGAVMAMCLVVLACRLNGVVNHT
jgi:hypothetical protein